MAAVPSANVPAVFELKSASLTLVSLVLKTADLGALAEEMQQRFGDSPNLFDNDPVVLDLTALVSSDPPLDIQGLVALLQRYKLRPIAVKATDAGQIDAALAAGLVEAALDGPGAGARTADAAQTVSATDREPSEPAAHAVAQTPEAPSPARMPAATSPTLIIDKPLRSGQQVYARGGDVVVLAVVNFGAEVIADGSIHVYAPLRGRAIAGARGDASARIFSTCMEPQLVSIAGTYRTTDTALPADVAGKPAQVRLNGAKLSIEPLKP